MTMPATSDDRERLGGGNRPMDDDLQVPNSSAVLKDAHVPFDCIVMDILSLLPVKTLIRFKSVSRNFNSAITNSPRLISLHLKNYTNNPAAIKRPSLLCAYRIEPSKPVLWPHPKRAISLSPDLQPTNSDKELASRVVCSAGEIGVLLLGYPSKSNPDICLWNPSTRQIRRLPNPYDCIANESELFIAYGVGLDLVSDDIKVVVIHSSTRPRISSQVLVYTLGSGCRKEIEGVDAGYFRGSAFAWPTYFRGSLYWLCRGTSVSVVAFDMGTDSFRVISCDFIRSSVSRTSTRLFIYRDSIALFEERDSTLSIWLLSSGFGSDSSWIKHSTLRPSYNCLSLLVCLNDDQFVGSRVNDYSPSPNYQLVMVDISGGAQEIDEVLIPSSSSIDGCFGYRETLVSLG